MTFVSVVMSDLNNTNTEHTNVDKDKNCTWKYHCLGRDSHRQCTELSRPEIECGLGDHIIDVATRCPSGQAHDFRGKCRKIFP